MSNTLRLAEAKKLNDKNMHFQTFDDNLADILIDALAGDPKALERPEIESVGIGNIRAALNWLATADLNNDYKDLIANEGWRLSYKRKPPTPEEYLTPEWIGAQAEGLWPNVKKAFCEFMDPNPLNPKRGLALSTSIGWGKANPVDTNLVVDKRIDLELEDGTKLSIPSCEEIEIEENGKITKILANSLLKKDLSTIDFPQPMISKYTK